MRKSILFSIFALQIFCFINCAPLDKVTFPSEEKDISAQETVDFLRNFGYLSTATDPNGEAFLTKEVVEDALKNMQKFGNIPVTGKLDDATKKLLISPRCGNRDVAVENRRKKRYVIGSKGWKKRKISYNLANWTPKLGNESAILTQISKAFSSWSDYSSLRFERVSEASKADIVISFGRFNHGDRHPFDGPGRILAHAFYPYDSGHFGGDVHFDEDENWIIKKNNDRKDGSETDFFTVTVHEIGHSLGLAHSSDPKSIMFPYYQAPPNLEDFSLGYDDILAMYELYIQNFDGVDEELSSTTTTSTTTTITTTTSRTTSDSDYQDDEGDRDDDSLCSANFDAFANIRGEIFAFRGNKMWRFNHRGSLRQEYPVEFRRMFPGIPAGVNKIDAIYEKSDGIFVFFAENRFFLFDGIDFFGESPLTNLGLPPSLQKVDAAFLWPKNGKTYFFSGNQYWRFNETENLTELGYPLTISARWKGVPIDLDGVFTWKTGKTFFFKENSFWELNDQKIVAEKRYDASLATYWLGC